MPQATVTAVDRPGSPVREYRAWLDRGRPRSSTRAASAAQARPPNQFIDPMAITASPETLPKAPRVSMSAQERRSSMTLASIYGLRMLGLFLILPVFAIYTSTLPGGSDQFLVGLA
ncbi:MAG: hypothetical protein ABI040_05120, partial [Rhodoferax sp.]